MHTSPPTTALRWLAVLLIVWVAQTQAETGKVTVRVLDAATSDIIPARLVIKTAEGKHPLDRLGASADQWPHIEAHAIFIDGEETFELPAGSTTVTAGHGLEFVAQTKTRAVKQGEDSSLEFRLKRVADMRSAGWVCGDLHVHMIHGEMQRKTSYEDVALTCAANGLDFVCVGQEYVDAGSIDLAGYQEKCHKVSTDTFTMFLGGERPKNILGHQVILGCENPFVISEEPPYFQSHLAVHEQGGVVAYVHPLRYFPGKQYGGQWLDFPGNNLARELVFDAFLGPSFDGLSVLSDEPANADAHQLWFNLLNRGLFVPVMADSDACFDRPTLGLKAPGFWNTYFYLGPDEKLTQPALAEAVRRGRTFATTGPLVQFRIDGKFSGDTLPLDGKSHEATIEVHYPQHAFSLETTDARSSQPMDIARVELIRNGKVVHQWQPKARQAKLAHTLEETQPCWYAVRVFGTDERWQVALTSPIYFAEEPVASKREPLSTLVRGRIYDFATGKERTGAVEIRRHNQLLKRFEAEGQFRVRMPLDAEITVAAKDQPAITKNLLLDYGPIHRFLWYLESRDLGKPETLDRMEFLARQVDLEFPLGHRLAGCYLAKPLTGPAKFGNAKIVAGPEAAKEGTVAVAAVLADVEQIAPGDTLNVAAIFRDEGTASECGPYVVEARGYDPARPTGFGALKRFASFEKTWATATDLGDGYKLISGKLMLPDWIESGPAGFVDLSIRARKGHGDAAFIGMAIPLGETKRGLMVTSSWPTMPMSWPDRSYGVGPLKVCNRIGKKGRPLSDYRQLHFTIDLNSESIDLHPHRDGRGCADADNAMYYEHFFDQVLNDESKIATSDPVREQPEIKWRDDVPLIEATP